MSKFTSAKQRGSCMISNERLIKECVHGTDAILRGRKMDVTKGVGVELRETCGNTAIDH
jgi:hypothetical protein